MDGRDASGLGAERLQWTVSFAAFLAVVHAGAARYFVQIFANLDIHDRDGTPNQLIPSRAHTPWVAPFYAAGNIISVAQRVGKKQAPVS